jgi:uncharacterized Zn finger protein
MIKVLAAELSDQGRLARGKRYWADQAVIDIVVGHGAVTAEIQGSRPEPYIVTLEAAGGAGVPSKRDLWVQCTCPDDTGSGSDACKHAVAALFALSDEVAIEPELVDRWRKSARAARPHRDDTHREIPTPRGDDTDDEDGDGHEAEVIELRARRDPELDAISVLLQAPAGAAPPDFGEIEPIDHTGIRDRMLAEVLDDALDHLAIRWE